uniref:Uncharacterized protein n=1 Tax=Arundo donax TaxID=35708 RepID=A0A0A9VCE1_ARUDO
MDIYRCKGILHICNSDQVHTLQAVREVYEVVPAREWSETVSRVNKIVFIGRNLDIDALRDSFSGCKYDNDFCLYCTMYLRIKLKKPTWPALG